MPRPAAPARIPSRQRRPPASGVALVAGRKFSASSSRMTVTTSTRSWVSARSGAEKPDERQRDHEPDDADQDQRGEPVPVARHEQGAGGSGEEPHHAAQQRCRRPRSRTGAAAARHRTSGQAPRGQRDAPGQPSTERRSVGANTRSVSQLASRVAPSSNAGEDRPGRPSAGARGRGGGTAAAGRSRRPRPPVVAIALISSGRLKPCQTPGCRPAAARPRPPAPLPASSGPTITAGKHADHQADSDQDSDRHAHPARRLVRRARQVRPARRSKNTSWMKRSE